MESIWTWTAAIVLGGWLAASVVHQLRPRWWSRIARHDAFNLLPSWSFFAPNPGREDLHLVYRDRSGDGPGPWRLLDPGADDVRCRCLWNPARFPRKAVHDLANGLLQAARANAGAPRVALLSGSYLAVLHWVMSQPAAAAATTHRQFALVASAGSERGLTVRFVSEEHPLDS